VTDDPYSRLSPDDRAQIADEQIAQLERQRFMQELDLARLEALPEDKRDDGWPAAKNAAREAIESIDIAIGATKGEIAKLRER
jgi:hypothetical protein